MGNKMNIIALCNGIDMPEEVTKNIIELQDTLDYAALQPAAAKLFHRMSWAQGLEEAKDILGEDKNGFKILTFMLITGLETFKLYEEKGIGKDIFFDTFKCFSRFVREHMASFHTYGFDRGFWTPRHIAMEEFRLGELEFEIEEWKEEVVISVHSPSDAKISKENCMNSYSQAKEFFQRFYPNLKFKYFICDSWMLSPALKEVLSPESRIIQFQEDYTIDEWNKEDPSYKEWVFKNPKVTIEEMAEGTSLQRNIKEFVKSGGCIGTAVGYIKMDY